MCVRVCGGGCVCVVGVLGGQAQHSTEVLKIYPFVLFCDGNIHTQGNGNKYIQKGDDNISSGNVICI